MRKFMCLLSLVAALLPSVCYGDVRAALRSVYKVGATYADSVSAVGSAVVVAPGKLVTSCHTIRGAQRVTILHRQGALSAGVGAADIHHDLCILSVPELRGPVAARAQSSAIEIGQRVFAAGYGHGYRLSVAEGQISALYRMDGGRVVRTSATFPRGASGGGLFTESGLLVGILTFRGTAGGQLNYAVPTEWVQQLLEQGASARAPATENLSFWEDDASTQSRFLQAAWLEATGEWAELEAAAVDWVLDMPEDAEAWLALGRAKLELYAPKEAALALRRSVACNTRHVIAWYWLAVAYYRAGLLGDFVYASSRLENLDLPRAIELGRRTSSEPAGAVGMQ